MKSLRKTLALQSLAHAPVTTDDESPPLVTARRVLTLEAKALSALAAALDGNLAATIDVLATISGRVVATGMGKSGHVARKFAATLASTGTPSLYVHPGEASHGDLGMVTADDAVVALSNSGETTELSDLLAYAKRHSIPVIGITGRDGSTLAEQADLALILPPAAEACPMGLAPTTSTTAMLALGDAIAVALLERRGFTVEDFQVLHPGGKLGQKLLRVSDLMHDGAELPLAGLGTTMADVLVIMTAKRFGCAGVVTADGRLVGIVTDGDLRRYMSPNFPTALVERVMTRNPKTIRGQALAAEALGLMNANNITSLVVVEEGMPCGILHVHDCLRAGVA